MVILRPAIAMIELIFALVIMGIVLMSAPQLISQANKSSYTSMQQEGIAAAASQMSLVLTRHWDEANTNQLGKPTILTTNTSAAIALDDVGGTGFRRGTPNSGEHRTFMPPGSNIQLAATAGLGQDGAENDTDDIDDYDGTISMLRSLNANGNGADDYIDKTMEMTTTVEYVDDTPTNAAATFNHNGIRLRYDIADTLNLPAALGPTSNIKWIRVRLSEAQATRDANVAELSKLITLHAFSCNIGGYKLRDETL